MNSFAMIFGHCVWIPPSSKAALVALGLFFGIGVTGEPDVAADKAIIASQYVSVGKTPTEAQKEVAALEDCFGSYEVPTANKNHPEQAHFPPAQSSAGP